MAMSINHLNPLTASDIFKRVVTNADNGRAYMVNVVYVVIDGQIMVQTVSPQRFEMKQGISMYNVLNELTQAVNNPLELSEPVAL
jgi:hypothetical protein